MRKKIKVNAEYFTIVATFVIAFSLIFWGLHSFYTGYVNFDSAQNMRFISCALDTPINDIMSDGVVREPETIYIMGVNQVFRGVGALAGGMFMLGMFYMGMSSIILKPLPRHKKS